MTDDEMGTGLRVQLKGGPGEDPMRLMDEDETLVVSGARSRAELDEWVRCCDFPGVLLIKLGAIGYERTEERWLRGEVLEWIDALARSRNREKARAERDARRSKRKDGGAA